MSNTTACIPCRLRFYARDFPAGAKCPQCGAPVKELTGQMQLTLWKGTEARSISL